MLCGEKGVFKPKKCWFNYALYCVTEPIKGQKHSRLSSSCTSCRRRSRGGGGGGEPKQGRRILLKVLMPPQPLVSAVSLIRVCVLPSVHPRGGHVITLCEGLSQCTGSPRTLQMCTSNMHYLCNLHLPKGPLRAGPFCRLPSNRMGQCSLRRFPGCVTAARPTHKFHSYILIFVIL